MQDRKQQAGRVEQQHRVRRCGACGVAQRNPFGRRSDQRLVRAKPRVVEDGRIATVEQARQVEAEHRRTGVDPRQVPRCNAGDIVDVGGMGPQVAAGAADRDRMAAPGQFPTQPRRANLVPVDRGRREQVADNQHPHAGDTPRRTSSTVRIRGRSMPSPVSWAVMASTWMLATTIASCVDERDDARLMGEVIGGEPAACTSTEDRHRAPGARAYGPQHAPPMTAPTSWSGPRSSVCCPHGPVSRWARSSRGAPRATGDRHAPAGAEGA